MKIKTSLLSSVVAGASILSVGSANAIDVSGRVVEISTNSTTAAIYVSTAAREPTSYVYWCTTTNPIIAQMIAASLHQRVKLSCDGPSWPTTGAYRLGGNVTVIFVD